MYTVGILILNNPCFKGVKENTYSVIIAEALTKPPFEIVHEKLLPVDPQMIREKLLYACDSLKLDLILTCGGTGLGPKDLAPEITKEIIDREIPGIPEAMRAPYFIENPKAMLSRSIAGLRGKTLIINLPGSSGGVKDSLDVIKGILPRALGTIQKKEG